MKVFSLNDIYLVDPNFRQSTLYDWEKQELVKKIRNKWYVFDDFQPEGNDYYLISNKIYSPSYISLELALNHYSVIPESVSEITAMTTRKTKTFQTKFGDFVYKSIKESLFFGYKIFEYDNLGVTIASLEKTILDYLYLNSDIKHIEDFAGLRFNKEIISKTVDKNKLSKYLEVFNSSALRNRIKILHDYLDK